jgi:hypothetical protein
MGPKTPDHRTVLNRAVRRSGEKPAGENANGPLSPPASQEPELKPARTLALFTQYTGQRKFCRRVLAETEGFEPSIRLFEPYNGLANRRLQPLGHVSGRPATIFAFRPRAQASSVAPSRYRSAGQHLSWDPSHQGTPAGHRRGLGRLASRSTVATRFENNAAVNSPRLFFTPPFLLLSPSRE